MNLWHGHAQRLPTLASSIEVKSPQLHQLVSNTLSVVQGIKVLRCS
ncbi:hypothetical protein LINGRAHAP2_LOCUS8246 [Linum grandiflorum]